MDQQAQLTVCRLCLKDVEANISCLPITNNSLVLQNLNLISFATIRNLQLTEEPVLCELCEEKLKKLAYFKENVITNEFKIQCHQKRDINFFLQTLSSDIDQICRLCLKTSAYNFDKTWKDNKKLFVKCNIHLNLNISKPSKMCEECYKMLQETYYFVCDSIEKEKFIVSTYSLKKETLIGKDLLNIFNSLQKFDNNKAAGSESPDTSDVVENNNNVNDDENLDSTLIDNKPEAIPISHNNITTKAATELERSCNQPLAEQETYEMPKQASAAIDLIVVHEKNITVINKCDDSSEKAPGLALSEQSGEQLIQRVESPVEQQEIGSATKCDEEKESGMEPQDSNKEIKSLALTDTKPKNDSNIIKKGLHKTTEVKGDSNSVKTEASERNHEEKNLNELSPADTENNNKQNDDTSAAAVDNDIEKKKDHSVDKTVLKASNDPTPNVAEVSTAISCNGDPKQTESGKGKEFQANRDWSFLDAASQDLTSIFGEVSECSDSVNDMYKITETVDVVEINVSTTNGKSGFSGRNKSISPSRQELIDLLEDNVSMDIPVNDSQVATLEQGTKVGGDEDKDNSNVDIEDNKINENKAGLKKKGMPKKGIKLEVYPEKEEIRKAVEQRGENNKPINIRVSPRNKNIKAEKQHKLKRGKNKEISPEIRKSPRTKVTEGVLNQNKQLDAKSKMSPKDDVFPDSEPLNFVPGRGRPKKTINAELKFDDSFDSGVVSDFTDSVVMSASNPRKRTRKSVREAEPAQKRTRTKIERPDVETKAAQEEECGSVSKEVSAGIDAPTSSFGAAPRDGADCQVGEGESKADTSAPVVNGLRIIRRTNRSNSEAEKKWLELISGTSSNNSGSTIEGAEKKQITNTKIKTRKRRARESTPIVEFLGVNADAPPPMPPPAADGPKKFYEKALTCDRCQYRTKSRDMLTQHQLIHNLIDSVKKFRCKSCSFQAKSQELLDQHKLTHLDVNTTYKCVYCEFKAKKKVSLLHHIIRHEDKPVDKEFFCCYINCDEPTEAYECLQCEFQSAAWDTLVSHVADHEATNTCNPNIEMFKCSFCSYKTKTEELLSRHEELHKFPKYIKKSDESDTLLKCDKCAFATVNKRSLQNHFSKKHGSKDEKKPKPQSDELFYCAQCPYLTDRKPNITRHVLVHMTKKNVEFWECPHCPFETKHRRSYIRHMVCVHNVVV